MLLLLLGTFASSPTVVGENLHSAKYHLGKPVQIGLDQGTAPDLYYPIFDSINTTDPTGASGNEFQVRARNNSLGEGAIVQLVPYSNVTFTYAVVLSNTSVFDENQVSFRLFADLPRVNSTNFNNTASTDGLSLTDSAATIPLSYTGNFDTSKDDASLLNYTQPADGSVIRNATKYYFQTTSVLNMSVSQVPFYVADTTTAGLRETDSNQPYNLLTVSQYFDSQSQDEFYIQNELVNITGNLYFANTTGDHLGLKYQIDGGKDRFKNFTLSFTNTAPFNGTANMTLRDTSFPIDTTITWSSVYYYDNDTMINQSRVINNIESKSVDVGDGTPSITVKVDPNNPNARVIGNKIYSYNFSITYYVTANVAKGNISTIQTISGDDNTVNSFNKINSTFDSIKVNQTVDYTTYPSATANGGKFNTTIFAETNKGLSVNKTYYVIVDRVKPSGSFTINGGNSIKTHNGEVNFNFNYTDDNAGVLMAIIDFGDGVSQDVSGMNNITHHYLKYDDQSYSLNFTIIDYAGNAYASSGFITLSQAQLSVTSARSLGVIIFWIVLIGLVTSPVWGPKVSEKILNR